MDERVVCFFTIRSSIRLPLFQKLHKNIEYQKNDKVLDKIQGLREKLGPKRRRVGGDNCEEL